ncbi:MAG: serine/threonine-protein kinase [Ardenticatenaceae bacterium]
MDLTGRKLGKYQIVKRLGRGGMAMVYEGYQPDLERHVAIKVLHKHLAADPDFVERFRREARAMGQLQHRNLVRLIDFDIDNDQYYMVMEFIEGGTLGDYLKKKAPLPAEEALYIMGQLTDALGYAHDRGMIHRDIKPANIMFMAENGSHAVLMDFGLARILGEDGMTVTGQMIGTPAYMSLEAVQGDKVDKRTDIYSLGVVLYEMLTGRTPYIANTPYKMILKQLHDPLPPPRQVYPALPEAVEQVVLKALAKEPNERYQSAQQFYQAIEQTRAALNANQPLGLPPATTSPRPKVRPKNNSPAPEQNQWMRFAVAVGGVLLIVVLMMALLSALA